MHKKINLVITVIVLLFAGTVVYSATRAIVPRSDSEGGIGTPTKVWLNGYFDYASTTIASDVGTVLTGVWNGTAIGNAYLTNSTISGISLGSNLAALTATNGTLTFSGDYTGATARTVGLNLGNANTWTALQTFGNASTTQIGSTGSAYFATVSGNVGIGTTSPGAKLSVAGGVLINDNLIASNITATGTLSVTGNVTFPASFGGRSLTVNGTALDADTELYTKAITFKLVSTSTSAMSTSTNYASFQVPVASTITNASGWCDGAATTSVSIQERTNPEIAGSEIFGGEHVANIFTIGDNSATTTFRDSAIAANAFLVVDLDGYLIGTPTRCFLNIKMTAND